MRLTFKVKTSILLRKPPRSFGERARSSVFRDDSCFFRGVCKHEDDRLRGCFQPLLGAVKGIPINGSSCCRSAVFLLRPEENDIIGIKIFYRQSQPRPDDPDQPTRPEVYFRALRTIPNLQIVHGHYLSHVVWMPLAKPGTRSEALCPGD